MSTSIILLDQNFNANDVEIMVFEPFVLSAAAWGEKRHGPNFLMGKGNRSDPFIMIS